MESLETILSRYMDWTDKERTHHYFTNYYGKAFEKYRERENVVVEVGVYVGGSIRLLNDYFVNSYIYGLEDSPVKGVEEIQNGNPRIHLIFGDGYSESSLSQIPDIDIFIDDGSHTLKDQVSALDKYLPKMKPGGLFVIEDLADEGRILELMEHVPERFRPYAKTVGQRQGSGGQTLLVIEVPD